MADVTTVQTAQNARTGQRGAGRLDVDWPDQSHTYGEQFHDVYHHFFPAGPGRVIADVLAARVTRIAGTGRPSVVELGVGSGRVALPLVGLGIDVLGVDSSEDLLAVARRDAAVVPAPAPTSASLDLELADIRSWLAQPVHDAAVCVCATISMFSTDSERVDVLRTARDSIHQRGVVIVETHDPAFVRSLHGELHTLDFDFPADGLAGVVGHSVLDGSHWQVDFEWSDGGRHRRVTEHSRLLESAELAALAEPAGLRQLGVYSSWTDLRAGAVVDEPTGTHPTYIIEFEHRGEVT